MPRPYRGEPYDDVYFRTLSQTRPEGYHDYVRFLDFAQGQNLWVNIANDIEAQPQIGPVAEMDVLDAGCAYGYLTNELAQRGANVIGIDLSAWAIAQAQANFPTLDFREMDLIDTTFKNNEFDLVVVAGVIECMNDDLETTQMLNEVRRITHPSGVMYCLLDYNRGDPPFIYLNRTWDEWLAAFEAGIPGPFDFAAEDIGHLPLYYGSRLVVSHA